MESVILILLLLYLLTLGEGVSQALVRSHRTWWVSGPVVLAMMLLTVALALVVIRIS
jgi:hypothetical protein